MLNEAQNHISAKTARGEESRVRILDNALSIVREEGIGALSVSTVCQRAQIAPTSIYHHFGSKAGLLQAMIHHALSRSRVLFLERVARGDREEALDNYIETLRDVVLSKEGSARHLVNALSHIKQRTPEISRMLAEAREAELDLMSREYCKYMGLRDGSLFAQTTSAYLNNAVQAYQETGDTEIVDRILKALKEVTYLIAVDGLDKLENRNN